jgi:hypothetical protein
MHLGWYVILLKRFSEFQTVVMTIFTGSWVSFEIIVVVPHSIVGF